MNFFSVDRAQIVDLYGQITQSRLEGGYVPHKSAGGRIDYKISKSIQR